MRHACLLFILLAVLPSNVFAHEVRPAYLEMKQTGPETYDVFWKVPGVGDKRLALYVRFPEGTTNITDPRTAFIGNAYTDRWSIKQTNGLTGGTIFIDGLSATQTDVLVRMERQDGTTQVVRLAPDKPSFTVEAAPAPMEIIRTYLVLGIEHILLGIDHLLFVLAMLILVKGWRRLVGTISAFTIAHSITLAAATLGLVSVPIAPVEAVIALSIVFVACEIVHRWQGRSGLTESRPWVVSFTFGLLHGFGFASALHEVGLPQNAIPAALLFFNVGVEVGQLLFIAAVMSILYAITIAAKQAGSVSKPSYSRAWELTAAYAIGSIAIFWVIERTLALLS